MALPATDTFTTSSDYTSLATYSANWVENSQHWEVVAATDRINPYGAGGSYDWFAHWAADSFSNDQYAQVTVTATLAGTYAGPAVRVAATTGLSGIEYTGDDNETYVVVVDAEGSATQKGSGGSGWSAGVVARIEVSGTTITPKKNGSTDTEIGAQSDSTLTSGYAGVTGGQSGLTSLDNWEGGNLGGANVPFTPTLGSVALTGIALALNLALFTTPAVASVAITGLAPTITVGVVASVPVGSLAASGQAPALLTGSIFLPGAGTVTLDGISPVLALGGDVPMVPEVGAATLTGAAPILSLGFSLAVSDAGALILTGAAPVLMTGAVLLVAVGDVVLTGAAPDIGISYSLTLEVGTLTLGVQTPTAVVTEPGTRGWYIVTVYGQAA